MARCLLSQSESHQQGVEGEEEDSESSLSKTLWHSHRSVCFAALLCSACFFKLPCECRAELMNNEEMAGRGQSFIKVPLEIQGMRFTVEEIKEKK